MKCVPIIAAHRIPVEIELTPLNPSPSPPPASPAALDELQTLPPRRRLAAFLAVGDGTPTLAPVATRQAQTLAAEFLPPLVFLEGGQEVRQFVAGFTAATRKTVLGMELRGKMGAVLAELDRLVAAAEQTPLSAHACLDALGRVERALTRYLAQRPQGSKRPWAELLSSRLEGARTTLQPLLTAERAAEAVTRWAQQQARVDAGALPARELNTVRAQTRGAAERLPKFAPPALVPAELAAGLVERTAATLAKNPIQDPDLAFEVGRVLGGLAPLEIWNDPTAKDQFTNEILGGLEIPNLGARAALLHGLFESGLLDASMVRELLVHRALGLDVDADPSLLERPEIRQSPTYRALAANTTAALAKGDPTAARDPETVHRLLAQEAPVLLVLTLWDAAHSYAPPKSDFARYLSAVETFYADASERGLDTAQPTFLAQAAQFDARNFQKAAG